MVLRKRFDASCSVVIVMSGFELKDIYDSSDDQKMKS